MSFQHRRCWPQTRRKLIVQFYNLHKSAGKSWTVKHFSQLELLMSVPHVGRWKVPKNHQEGGSTERVPGTDRPAVKLPSAQRGPLVKPGRPKQRRVPCGASKKFNVCNGSPWCFCKNDTIKPFLQEHHSKGDCTFWLLSKLLFCLSHCHPLRRARNTSFREGWKPSQCCQTSTCGRLLELSERQGILAKMAGKLI